MYEQYTDAVIEHFMAPKNVGSMVDADAEGSWGDPDCGDYLTIFIKVRNGKIDAIRFLVFGCVAAVATSSMATELVKGKTVEEAFLLTNQDITDALGGLPEQKLHCSILGAEAIKNAIVNYNEKQYNTNNL